MGDLRTDTEVTGGDGAYTGNLDGDWAIWGPCGGIVASVLLRAAGAHSRFDRPASLQVHFHSVGEFDTVSLTTETARAGKRSESVTVTMTQGDRTLAEARAWFVAADSRGLEHDWTQAPEMPDPTSVPTVEEQVPDWDSWYPFWNNFEYRPLDWYAQEEWEQVRPLAPEYQAWFAFQPTPHFDDEVVDACRSVVLLDIMGWPAAHRAVPAADDVWMAPNLDLAVSFHQPAGSDPYLFLDADAPLATNGLIGARGQTWSSDGRLVAGATQQMMCRPMPEQYRR